MSFQLPCEDKSQPGTSKSHKKSKRRKKRKAAKNTLENSVWKKRFVDSMSSWTEHFNVAATWQTKHQLAYWKARAKSLEYENQILHEIIKKNCLKKSENTESRSSEVESSDVNNPSSENEDDLSNEGSEDGEDNLEISEEFIEFLKANAKHKEEARLERESLKAKLAEEAAKAELEAARPESEVDKGVYLNEQYGGEWKKIAALEMFIQSNFINESDVSKPEYWPNIPFNFC